MANNGAAEAQLMAVFGWTDPKMAAHYTRTANRTRLAAQSIDMLNASRTSIPALEHPVRGKNRKRNEINIDFGEWWAREGSNLQPDGYEPPALTN